MVAPAKNLQEIQLDEKMRASYLDYAMSVIVSRALPDVRDGLKPVHRRVLYGMLGLGLRHNVAFRKSATVVGEVLGKYHPHGDAAVYDALVRMAQDFNMRYPLVEGQGNFGSIDGDNPAAMRYTEVRLTELAEELLADIDKATVPFVDNFDGRHQQPVVLPARLPNLLLNGSDGIAVGMATKIPPHNLGELVDAITVLIDNPDASVEEFVAVMPGPDFPGGGLIIGREGIAHAYATGSGKITLRAATSIESDQKGREALIVTELPYQVNKAQLIRSISDLVRERKIDGIAALRDESDRNGMRIVIEIKRDAQPNTVLNTLLAKTNLQVTFGINMLGLVDGTPQTLPLKKALSVFIEHRKDVIRRRTEYDLDEANERRHVLQGLKVALDNLDRIIEIIRKSRTREAASDGLVAAFDLTPVQARAILDMPLGRLAALERQKILDELRDVEALVRELESILASRTKLMNILKKELREIKEKYGDERRTRILDAGARDVPTHIEDLVPQGQTVVALTLGGYLKRLDDTGGRNASRDPIVAYVDAGMRDTLLLFSAKGQAYGVPVHRIGAVARRSDKGAAVGALVDLAADDRVVAAIAVAEGSAPPFLVFATKNGQVKRAATSEYTAARSAGIAALRLDAGDELVAVDTTDGQSEILLSTKAGKAIRFKEDEVRPTGRVAGGVRGIKLEAGDEVLRGPLVPRLPLVVTFTNSGYARRTPLDDYPLQGRDGGGVKAMRLGGKVGTAISAVLFASKGGDFECAVQGPKVDVVDGADIPLGDRTKLGAAVTEPVLAACLSLGSVR
jgi:DNA gyrase subunit A